MRKLLLSISLFIALSLSGQDVHFSQFFHSPTFQNPANTGLFDGDFRGVFNQRTQWRSITDPYNTWALAIDGKNINGINDLHAGMIIFKDAAGTSPLNTVSIMPSAAYTAYYNSDSTGFINVGLQMGFTQKTLDFTRLQFDNQYSGSIYDPSRETGENFNNDKSSYLDIHSGATWNHKYSNEFSYKAGIALFHITSPKESFLGDVNVKLDRRFLVHAEGVYRFNDEWSAVPAIQWQSQGKYKELLIGGMAKRTLLDKLGLYRAVYLGAFARTKDAAYIVGAMDYDQWKVGISYDINLSDLNQASRSKGGFEFSLIYIFKGFNEKYKQHRICPSYI